MATCFDCDKEIIGNPTIGLLQGHELHFCNAECRANFNSIFHRAEPVSEWTPKGNLDPVSHFRGVPLMMTASEAPERVVSDFNSEPKQRRPGDRHGERRAA